jgi:hypothetical protein
VKHLDTLLLDRTTGFSGPASVIRRSIARIGATVTNATWPSLEESASTTMRRPEATAACFTLASSRLYSLTPLASLMPATPRKTVSQLRSS